MALTELQRVVCRLLAQNRIGSGESYVAGGAALNLQLAADRISRDIDLFHDSEEALASTWSADRRLLEQAGFAVRVLAERPGLVEAEVEGPADQVRIEWARDSSFRFFPLIEHAELGLTLHPFDLATNKVLALVGRLEVRDWVDVLECDRSLQPLGYLAWAACAKDPAFSPASILEHAARTARYSADELEALSFAGPAPDVRLLSRRWHEGLSAAREIQAELPPAEAGKCVLTADGELCRSRPAELRRALESRSIRFHGGRIRGALPRLA
jgi:hypothetical protein